MRYATAHQHRWPAIRAGTRVARFEGRLFKYGLEEYSG